MTDPKTEIVTANTLRELRERVEKRAQQGYEPVGSPTTEEKPRGPTWNRNTRTTYLQTMRRSDA